MTRHRTRHRTGLTRMWTKWWGWMFTGRSHVRSVAARGGSSRHGYVAGAESSALTPSRRRSYTRRTRRRGRRVYRVRRR